MRLDRNTNPHGLGKYALVEVRNLDQVDQRALAESAGQSLSVILDGRAIHTNPDFFVLKYSDRFALAALEAYRQEVLAHLRHLAAQEPTSYREARMAELREYERDIMQEIHNAHAVREDRGKIPD